MITTRIFNHATLREDTVPVPEALVQDIVTTMLTSKKWHDSLDSLHYKHRGWVQAMREAGRVPAADPAPAETAETWAPIAQRMHEQGSSWRAIGKATGISVSTLRRRLVIPAAS